MGLEFTILCPHHGQEESLKLPGSYPSAFEAEIPCPGCDPKGFIGVLLIKVSGGVLRSIEGAH
jgi:hypothetical protein